MSSSNYYDILGVDKSADDKAIRKAYLKLSLKYHPDKNTDNEEAAKAQFIKIGEAYEVLSDPKLRAAYDSGGYNPNMGFGGASSSSSQAEYENYQSAFDATMAGMSEDDLRDVMGAAAMIGGIVGSILGSKFMGKHTNNSVLQGVGSMVGSMVASEAASSFVQNAHSQSRERAAVEQDRRERVARGEEPRSNATAASNSTPKKAWQDLMKATAGSVKSKAAAALAENLTKENVAAAFASAMAAHSASKNAPNSSNKKAKR